jgi:FdhE protein
MITETRVLGPGQMEPPLGDIRFLFLPKRDLFGRRAGRLRSLSEGHALGEYLSFLSHVADAQQKTLNRFPALSLPGPAEQANARGRGAPLLAARSWSRDPAWRAGLTAILRQMEKASLPGRAQESINGLMQASATELEHKADRVLAGDPAGLSPRELPFLAAGLQVYWVWMASTLTEQAFGRLEQGGLCPVCGSYPGAGIVRSGGSEQGLRYLSCSLCASQWHMVRIKCSSCESTGGIDYHIMRGSNGAVKAEGCEECGFYLKLLYLGKDPHMEPFADDLATLSLDLLMDREGKSRCRTDGKCRQVPAARDRPPMH